MSGTTRPCIKVIAPLEHADMLQEWLCAAGFDAVTGSAPADVARVVATLVRWPAEVDLQSLPRPIILLYEAGADLQPVVGFVAEVLELPDSHDMKSLLAWSTKMSGVLWQIANQHVPAAPGLVPAKSPTMLPTMPSTMPSSMPSTMHSVGKHTSVQLRAAGPRVIALGISTGGPASLRVFFDGLGGARDLPPLVIVQHIPPAFVADLALRLRHQTGYNVQCCADNQKLEFGVAYIAPGDHHVRLVKRGEDLRAVWDDRPAIRGHCPSVEVLFESYALLKQHGIAVMMTGMGRDGADSMLLLRQQGWATVGQNEASCTIYGMPAAAKAAGAIERELDLSQIAPWLLSYCRRNAASA